ncbi:MAG: flagellar hook-associated protein FlgL [Alcaligenaceae bacterium]|nr:flagellar hook-associated protein FlgL [Alcaligenaceae bacterium]
MRISTSQFYKIGLNTINTQQARQLDTFNQIGTGKKITSPKDDPLGAARALNLANTMAVNDRFAENRSVAMQNLKFEESILSETSLAIQAVQSRLVEAGNGTLSDADRATLGEVVDSLREQLLGLANSTDGNGQYLFSGNKGNVPAFHKDEFGNINWQGDTGNRAIQVSSLRQMSSADTGHDVFMKAVSGANSYVTAAAAGNTGTGVINNAQVLDPAANSGQNFAISFSGSPLSYTVEVSDASGAVTGTEGPYVYDASNPGITLSGGVKVSVSGQPQVGDSFTVNNIHNENINIFDTLAQLSDALNTPIANDEAAKTRLYNTLAFASGRIEANHNAVLNVRASVGIRMNEIDALDASGEQRALDFKNEISNLEDVDFYEATTELMQRNLALQAASMAFSKIQGLSLFEILR